MKKISVLLVDDERYSREELKHLLMQYEIIEIVGEADSGETALIKTLQLKPDVVFLDIEMPKMSGMETAIALKELKHGPLIVFATAFPTFAVDAFRYDAIDYILKPFEEDRLKETITKLEERLISTTPQVEITPPSKLAVESDEGIIYIDPNDILYLYRDDRVTKIVGKTAEFETKTPLKDFELRLKDHRFFRIHKSYIVNLQDVSRLIPWFNGAYQLELKGHKELLSVSRNYVKALRSRLEI
ncbi:LytR/AlgR family response regulator transcription factor [Metabacillus bambusae]|uniref:Response regulator transcription factor n=1 Tax=Metabacillus bambusae TaxID=2795218 RepID=A0ABS3N8B5_9BACI|nr:LytTR family DNA-binding domain-containing protein [Metabacillus bambusae]MBO1514530.1 response regulator transcription factor [Metabacillus bambusae]